MSSYFKRVRTVTVQADVTVDDFLDELEPEEILDYIEDKGLSVDGRVDDPMKYHLTCIKHLLFNNNGVFPNELKQAIGDYIDNNIVNIIE
jgi:hypothetical protein